MERRYVAGIPGFAEAGSAEIPVRANFPGHCAQVVPEVRERRPSPEPIPVIDAVNDESRLEYEGMRNHGVVFRVRILCDVEIPLNGSLRIGEKSPLGAERST